MSTKKTATANKSLVNSEGIGNIAFGLGASVGRSGPFPFKLELPTDEGPKTATFWLYPWNHRITATLSEIGVSTSMNLKTEHEIKEQNVASAPLLLDKEKGWENLFRVDGTEYVYEIPTEDNEATLDDPRTVLALDAPAIFAKLKSHAMGLTIQFRKIDSGNSKSSSGGPSKAKAKAKPKQRRASSKRASANKAK